jgi:hypothetical protein
MTDKQRDILFIKDVREKPRWLRAAIALDQLIGVIIWNNSQDETISSKIGRRKAKGIATKVELLLCKLLSKLEYNHCSKSMGE